MKTPVAKYDQAMAVDNSSDAGLRYIPLDTPNLRISGFAFPAADGVLRRLPEDPGFSPGVAGLSHYTAGGRIDFRSNTKRIWLKVKLKNPSHMDHMPDTGSCGFDLYIGDAAEATDLTVGTALTSGIFAGWGVSEVESDGKVTYKFGLLA